MSGPPPPASELHSRRELPLPLNGSRGDVGDRTGLGGGIDLGIGEAKIHVVKNVEGIRAEPNVDAFGDRDLLHERDVALKKLRPAKRIAAHVSELSTARALPVS